MRCPNCEGEDFTEDDATGQLICLECGTATGRYEGITQSQEFTETRGLRVVGTALPREGRSMVSVSRLEDSLVSRPTATTSKLNDSILSNLAPEDPQWTSTQRTTNEADRSGGPGMTVYDLPDSPRGSPVASDEEISRLSLLVDKTMKPKVATRPWRLCEPFTYIMRLQTNEFARELQFTPDRRERFSATVWRLWLNYLAITGELGEKAWRVASDAPGKALHTLLTLEQLNRSQRIVTESRHSLNPRPRGRYKPRPLSHKQTMDILQQSWQVVQRRLEHFLWVGWGSLYEPNEGREARDPFLQPLRNTNIRSMHKLRRQQLKKRRAATASATSKRTSVKKQTKRPAPQDQPDDSQDTVQDADADKENDDDLFPSELPPITALADETAVDLLRNVAPVPDEDEKTILWRDYLIDKLSKSDPWKRVLWRGQLMTGIKRRGLLEFNLAILFFAYLTAVPTRSSVNPISWPHKDRAFLTTGSVALTNIVTLQDLVEMCRENRLTFNKAGECLPRDMYMVHDPNLARMFNFGRLPNIVALTNAATRLMHLLGFYQLPKFPFSWLVQRYIVILGLPEAIHPVVRLLLLRFQASLRHCTTLLTGPTLVSFIPWNRLLRVEVVAMAFVVITLRLLFKFDDVSEHRLSQLSKALTILNSSASSSSSHPELPPLPFDWAAWACYIDRRFLSPITASGSTAKHGTGLLQATSDDLERLESVSDLLGSNEFVPGKSVGWGEGSMYQRKHAHPDTKNALSKPIRDLLDRDGSRKPRADSIAPVEIVELTATNIPWLCGSLRTRTIQAGLQSSFRHTTLDYLLDTEVDITKLTGESLPTLSDVPMLTQWWRDLVERRSHYHLICTGRWSPECVDVWAHKHRSRLEQKIVLPEPVERLIKEHDEQLVEAIQISSEKRVRRSSHTDERNSVNLDSDQQSIAGSRVSIEEQVNGVDTEDDSLNESDALSVEPSESIQWLVELCSTVCGATDQQHLLREIFSLERLLFDVKRTDQKKRSAHSSSLYDLALYSCLDLNDQL